MADEITISNFGVNAPPLYRMTVEDGSIVIRTYDTNYPLYRIDGDLAGGAKPMTTAERTATTPELGQLIWDTDLEMLYAGDGETAGGVQVSPGTGGGDYTQGYGIEIKNGATISRAAYGTIETVDVSVASPSVTMVPGHAYSVNATAKAVTLNVAPFNSNQFGIDDGHLEIFVANTGYVKTGANVELANALEPDSINYCTVRFVGGVAKIALEDNIGGYVVTINAASGEGSLYYGLATALQEYIAVDASLNGQTLDMGGAVTSGEKHVVGNGYADTILTGGVSCTSKTTFANLTMSGVVNSGGTMTLGDVNVESVSIAGGALAVEKVTGNGGVIDLGGTTAFIDMKDGSEITGTTITGYAETANIARGVINMGWTPGSALMSSCTITGNTHTNGLGGAVNVFTNTSHSACELTLSDCVISGNAGPNPICVYGGGQDAVLVLKDTVAAEDAVVGSGGKIVLDGAVIVKKIANYWQTSDGVVTISSGASINLTSSIVPGGAITVLDGGCTVNGVSLGSAGGSTTYTSIVSSGGSAVAE